ncbi:LysE family translocator [Bacteroidota bacterium]
MLDLLSFLLSGVLFGTVAGISPGPLLTLIISETIKHNKKEGIKVAIAPLITDLPIILISLLLLSNLSEYNKIMAAIAFCGAVFIVYLAYKNFSIKKIEFNANKVKPKSWAKGILANFLSPHPYVFWISVGGTIFLKAIDKNIYYGIAYLLGFYIMLIGSKIFVAFIVDKSKTYLNSKLYIIIIRVLGVLLLLFAIFFINDGIKYLLN